MKMKIDRILIITTIVCLLPIAMSIYFYDRLPEQMPVHWNIQGQPDNYASREFAAFGLPMLMAALNFMTHMFLNNDPKKANYSAALKNLSKWLIPLLTLLLMPVTIFASMGYPVEIQVVVPIIVGVIITVCGNYLPKCKQNYTMGIKLPWTLNSEENWNRTHRMAGYLWTAGGIVLILATFLNLNTLPLLLTVLFVLVAVPAIYSYKLYKKGI
ncbi:MAG: SdpI family protein [Sedimentibacter sp.]|uniref:SdpI family protein n=1 Tax=Sedimentibacter sp. TaxID=1960295 RepID=UPI0031598B45